MSRRFAHPGVKVKVPWRRSSAVRAQPEKPSKRLALPQSQQPRRSAVAGPTNTNRVTPVITAACTSGSVAIQSP